MFLQSQIESMYLPEFETDCNQVELIFVTSFYQAKISHTSISIWDEPRGKNLRVESAHAQPFHFESCYLEWKKTHIPHQRRQLLSRPLDRWQRWFLLRGKLMGREWFAFTFMYYFTPY